MSLPFYFLIEHRKKILIGGGIGILFVVLVLSLFLWRAFQKSPDISNDFSRDVPKANEKGYFSIEGMGKNGQVQTKDFLVGRSAVNSQGDRFLAEESEYDISYINPFRQFFIAFHSVPTDAVRNVAESKLLDILGVSREEICKLDVHETIPAIEGDEYAGVNFGFSSCPNGRAIPR